jgi:flagellin-like hook-associated protein FlgL
MKTAEQQMLSGLQDADLTTVITRFSQLQEQLQGSLEVAAKELQTSLLDYLQA